MSGLAVGFGERRLSDEIIMWYRKTKGSHQINTLYGIPPLMLAEDIIVLLVFIAAAMVCCGVNNKRCCNCTRGLMGSNCRKGNRKCCHCCKKCTNSFDPTNCTDLLHLCLANAWWKFCAYSVIFPIMSIAIHANHILIGFIHNQQHALSVALFYVVVLITNVHVLRVIVTLLRSFYKWLKHTLKKRAERKDGGSCPTNGQQNANQDGTVLGFVLCLVVSVFINLTFAFIAAVYVIIPINNAFVEAPARLRQFYDTVILAIAAGFALWFYKQKKEVKVEETVEN